MKTIICEISFLLLFLITPALAQQNQRPARLPAQPALAAGPMATNSAGGYASDVGVVHDAQQQALEQARQMLAQGEGVRDRGALEAAIKEMERAQAALDDARKSPEKLADAIAAEQAAYQALLKVAPRETRVTQSRSGGRQGGGAGQAGQRELNQLDMPREENRYETETQAAAPQNARQREQSQTADRLQELAQRQQDLNGRLRELQTALQAARTDAERADIQRQLKRLQEEQRQMLANVDELRQQLAQSPDAGSQADTQRQLEQTRSDMERAAQEMDRQSASSALAAGTRAQETMQNLRDNLQKQTSSQFAEQMRQLRNQAREMTKQQEDIARGLDSLNNGEHQALDNSAERQQIVQQMNRQQGALTNLLSEMRRVTEQAETTEPLLSKQLYDTLRRADQMHTDNLLDMGSQLTDRGFLPQASQAERMARTNITELASSVERAADSVLGSEADALRYAQRELDNLTRQVERELGGAGTNAAALAAGRNGGAQNQSNRMSRAARNAAGQQGTNEVAQAGGRAAGNRGTNDIAGTNGTESANGSQLAGNNPQRQQRGQGSSPNGNQNGNRGERANGNGQQASADNPQNGQGEQGDAAGNNPGSNQDERVRRLVERRNRELSDNNSAPQNNSGRPGESGQQQGGQNGGEQQGANGGGGGDRLRQLAVQLGANGGDGGPITGGNYLNWSDRLRDVEQVVDPADLRNQLATVRERVSVLRADYTQRGRKPDADVVRQQIVAPLTQVRVWLQDELARQEKSDSLVPLDRDPVPDNYAELVRKYYEKLGSAQ